MLMNVFLFFPLGLTLPYALPEKWNRKGLLTIFLAQVFSIGIELAQYHFHLGRAETDDVICNTLGCVIGTLSYVISKKQKIFKEK
jgi:glycopeptide antibiotics resistance protein